MRHNARWLSWIVGFCVFGACTPIPADELRASAEQREGQWFDQLNKIDPSEHAIAGNWRKTADGLRTSALAGSRIAVPAAIPREYDLRVAFTRHSGQHSIALFFNSGSGRATFEIDAWSQNLAGIQRIGGQTIQSNSTRVEGQRLENGRRYAAEVQVRKESVIVLLDGKRLATYQGDGSDLSLDQIWQMPDGAALGLGAYQSEVTFHSVQLRLVSGKPTDAPQSIAMTKPKVSATKSAPQRTAATSGRRVLIVIANQHFFYREYADPRQELERAGFVVEVAAGQKTDCYPHGNSGQSGDGRVRPDFALNQVDPNRYEAIVFSGGWGASMYQYGFRGRYDNATYNGNESIKATANELINAFAKQDKHICGICNGVSVLAWSRVGGRSLLAGKTVTAPARSAPSGLYDGQRASPPIRWHVQQNQGRLLPAGSIGNPRSAADDVVVDGKIITAENDQSARQAGRKLAELLTRD